MHGDSLVANNNADREVNPGNNTVSAPVRSWSQRAAEVNMVALRYNQPNNDGFITVSHKTHLPSSQ